MAPTRSSLHVQPAEKQLLPLMESYYTLQGEGHHQGKAAYFIRLGGCDVGCSWCDVKDSWDAQQHPLKHPNEIAQLAHEHTHTQGERIAVITGGEPLMYNLDALCEALHQKNFAVHLETSGAYPLGGQFDWICVSPKKFKAPLPSILPVAHELKVIIYNKSDFQWAEQFSGQVGKTCKLFLQPEWSNCQKMLPLIIEYIQQHSKWALSLQIHKYLNIP